MAEFEDLIEEAEEQKKETAQALKKSKEVKRKLNSRLDDLRDEGLLDEESFSDALDQLEKSNYGKVREIITEAQQGTSFQFDDEEKEAFAEGFRESWDELQASVEEVRNALMDLQDSVDREKQERYIYGSTSMNLSEVEKIFDVIEEFTASGVDTDKAARALRGYNSSLKISDTRKVLEMIRDEAQESDL